MWFEKPDDAIIQSDGTFWSIMVQHTLIRLQGEWLTEGRIFTRHIFRIAWLKTFIELPGGFALLVTQVYYV